MSEVGSNTFSVGTRSRFTSDADPRRPVRMKCAKCGMRVLNAVEIKTLWALPPEMIRKGGKDRQILLEHWCLSCIRSANVEEDRGQINVSVKAG